MTYTNQLQKLELGSKFWTAGYLETEKYVKEKAQYPFDNLSDCSKQQTKFLGTHANMHKHIKNTCTNALTQIINYLTKVLH